MIRHQVDRRAPTRGGMIVSTGIHGLLLLLGIVYCGHQALSVEAREELVEISYIEARYGEDVAAKVRMKQPAAVAAGRGVSTRSAVAPPETPPAATPPAPAATEPALAEVEAPALPPVAQPSLPPAATLAGKTARMSRAPIVEIDDAKDARQLAETSSPSARPAVASARFRPQEAELASRNRLVLDPAADQVVGNLRGGGPAIATAADQADRLLAGGELAGGGGSYQSIRAGLNPAGGIGGGVRALADIAGPAPAGGSESRGRRTILDYGKGDGGGGNGLVGRGGRLVAAPAPESIVDEAQSRANQPVEEASDALAGDGVSMTITGQIAGREILVSVAPNYSDAALENGWEGVVVVHFTVLPDGRVKDNTYFEQTSAHRDLNRAAMESIRQFRFAPLPSGEMVEQWGLISIVFRLS